MKRYDYLIVGSGLYGSVCAQELTRRGKSVLVIERRAQIGGNCRSEKVDGIDVHKYGAHIFHTSNEGVWEYLNRFVRFNNYINAPIANYKGEIYNLPFNMNTFNRLWGVRTPEEAKRKLASQVVEREEARNLEEQALKLAGRDIYEKLIKGYTEKQWGRECKDLPAFLIGRIPLRFTYDNNYFNDRYQGIPEGGYAGLFEKLLQGVEVEVNADFEKERGRYESSAEKIIYTGAIDEYFGYCYGALEYRSLRFETERLEVEDYQGNAVVNYTDAETPYTRIIEHKHFQKTAGGHTLITREYPQEWKKGEEAYYPVNDEKNNALYERYRLLGEREKKVVFGGRLGSYRYADMDKTLLSALECVRQCLREN